MTLIKSISGIRGTIGGHAGEGLNPLDIVKFTSAYATMLNKILSKYKRAEVWCCTLAQEHRNGEDVFPEINENDVALSTYNDAIVKLARAFGCNVLDMASCGLTYQNMSVYDPNKLHPNKNGHSVIANYCIRKMDNYVRFRYSTE